MIAALLHSHRHAAPFLAISWQPNRFRSRADGAWAHDKFQEAADWNEDAGFDGAWEEDAWGSMVTGMAACCSLRLSSKGRCSHASCSFVAPSVSAAAPVVQKAPITTGTRVMVKNLDSEIEEDNILELFKGCGSIKEIAMHRDAAGNFRVCCKCRH